MKQRHKNIAHWDDERGIGNSLIVTLRLGLRFSEKGEHVRGFDTVKEAMSEVRNAQACDCDDCASVPAPRCYLSISDGKYRIIVQGMPICNDKATMAEAMAAAKQMKQTVADAAWNGDRGEWVVTSTIE